MKDLFCRKLELEHSKYAKLLSEHERYVSILRPFSLASIGTIVATFSLHSAPSNFVKLIIRPCRTTLQNSLFRIDIAFILQ